MKILQPRRDFLKQTSLFALGASLGAGCAHPAGSVATKSKPRQPWYRRTLRWGQTNITEADPANYDIEWWRAYWKRTCVQGIIVNAGGIVAYYPSRFHLQYRPETLGDRDLFGALLNAAREDGIVVLARMDSNRAHEDFYQAHPDWFALDAQGQPYKAGALFIACVNSPYYHDYLPGILREIIEHYRPDGFADNSWSGLGRGEICGCRFCAQSFEQAASAPLPKAKNWDDPVYCKWVRWNYARRLEIWEENNRVTQSAGGPDCLWIGMNSGSIEGQCQSFRDYRAICRKAELVLLDHQARGQGQNFSQNADAGQLVHGLLGWDKLVPESMAMYQAGHPTFRKTSKPKAEARLWMLEGLAGGLQPWWHHVGARQEDQRQFQIAESVYRWHLANEQFLINREPVASIGLVWSQQNYDFFGRDHANELIGRPWQGWTRALVQARIPYLPVHVDDLESQGANFPVLILPNLGVLSETQAAVIRRLVQNGTSLIATGRVGLYDDWGQPRPDFLIPDVLGCHYLGLGRTGERPREFIGEAQHSYLRLEEGSVRHEILLGFEDTSILPYGGWLGDVIANPNTDVLLTYVPSFPVYPPETSWMREARTRIPGLVLNSMGKGRVAFLIADIDRRFGSDGLPDHGHLLGNLATWAVRGHRPLHVEGPGIIDCRMYRQRNRFILHLVNLTNGWGSNYPVEVLSPVGPLKIRLEGLPNSTLRRARSLVRAEDLSTRFNKNHVTLTVPSLMDHEVVVIG